MTDARQTGKTTMVRELLGDRYRYVSFDDMDVLDAAKSDPGLFFRDNRPPIILDEIQYAPELFSRIKLIVDQSPEKGRFVLTGSQTYHLMRGVTESLAGRIALLDMNGHSQREVYGPPQRGAYIPGTSDVDVAMPDGYDPWDIMWRGSMPELQDSSVGWDSFYRGYIRSYLERDVRDLINVRDERRFYRFLVVAASRTGQLFNASSVANEVEVDATTVKGWLSVLEASGIVRMLRPFWSNLGKRLTKTPKLYFMDTGLACHLTRWNSSEALRRGAMAGHMFETFVVSEVLKSHMNGGRDAEDVYFYRDGRKREIDLVIQDGRVLHPVEVKSSSNPTREAIASFGALESLSDYEVGEGAVICQAERPHLIAENVKSVPVWAI